MAWNPVSEPPQPIQDLTIRILKGTIDDQELVEQIAQLLDAPDKENRLGDHYRYRLIEMAGSVPYFPPPGRYLMAVFGKTMPEPTPAQVKASLQNRRLALAKYAKGPFQAGSRYGEINSRYLYLSAGMVGVPIDQQELVNSVKHHSSIPVEMILSAVCAQEKIDPAIRPQLEHYATSEEPLALRVTDPNHNPRNTDPMAQPSKAYPLEQYYPIKELARKALSQMNGNEQAIERLIEPLFDSNFQMRKADEALREIASFPGITQTLYSKLESELAKQNAEDYRLRALMQALAVRSDYTPELMSAIQAKTKWALKAVKTGADRSHFFAEGNLRILANNPSAQNEEILILALSPDLDTIAGVQEVAVYALQKSGTSRARAALSALASRIQPKPGNKNRLYDLALETAHLVGSRIGPPEHPNVLPPIVSPAPKAPEAKTTVPTPSQEPTSSPPLSIIVVMIAAAGGLLWLQLKRRS
jgi:hypothetical protein